MRVSLSFCFSSQFCVKIWITCLSCLWSVVYVAALWTAAFRVRDPTIMTQVAALVQAYVSEELMLLELVEELEAVVH